MFEGLSEIIKDGALPDDLESLEAGYIDVCPQNRFVCMCPGRCLSSG